MLVLALVHARECSHDYAEGRAQLLHQKPNSGKNETTGSSRVYDTFFMNVGDFVEQREAVQEPPGVDKLPFLCIFPVKPRILAHAIGSASDTQGII